MTPVESPNDWLMPTIILATGALFGLIVLWRARASRPAESTAPAAPVEDLRAKFDLLIARLREFDDVAATYADPAAERNRLEREAALVLRELETAAAAAYDSIASTSPSGGTGAPAAAPGGSMAALRRLAWITAACAVLATMYVLLLRFATPRDPAASGPMATSAPADPRIAALERQVAAAPSDLELRLELAKAYLERQEMMKVFEHTQFILERDPDHARALSYQALVRLSMGEPEAAQQMLQRALQSEPNLMEAMLHLAIVYVEQGNRDAALGMIDLARRRHPDRAAMLASLREEIERRFAEPGAPSAATPAESDVVPSPAPPTRTFPLRITSSSSTPGVLFIVVRAAGATSGPPIAVKRIVSPRFPLETEITNADIMTTGELPERARIEARLDSDGDVTSKPATDPHAFVDNVTSATRVQLDLR